MFIAHIASLSSVKFTQRCSSVRSLKRDPTKLLVGSALTSLSATMVLGPIGLVGGLALLLAGAAVDGDVTLPPGAASRFIEKNQNMTLLEILNSVAHMTETQILAYAEG